MRLGNSLKKELLSKHYDKRAISSEKLQTKLAAASQCPISFLELTNKLALLQFARRQDGRKCSRKNDKCVLKN